MIRDLLFNKLKCSNKLFIISLLFFCSFTGREVKANFSSEQTSILDSVPGKTDLASVPIAAEFPGGQIAWLRYLVKNFRYPQEAMARNIQGQVIVKFIVDEKGRLKNINAISGAKELRQDAIRVIRESGRWTPAKENGHTVKSEREQAITFKLEQG